MTKYMAFDWGYSGTAKNGPLVRFLGTVDELPEEQEASFDESSGVQQFGFALVEQTAKFSENLMGGYDRPKAFFYVHYDHMNGIDKGSNIMVYYPILSREEYIEGGYYVNG